jgi:chemotaxis protein methyltransferase CheR
MDERYPTRERFDVIFFRNVMIYFDRATQHEVVRKQCRHLRKGGYLFIGHSENVNGIDAPLEPVGSSVLRKTS